MAQEWEQLAGHKGLFYRDYGQERTWMFRQMSEGKRVSDYLGAVTQERAVVIASQLRENRKLGAGPQSWKEMEAAIQETERAAKIQEEKERKQIIADDQFTRINTVGTFWDEKYWPKRKEKKSEHNNTSMEGVFRNWIRPIVGDISLQELSHLDVERMFENMHKKGKSVKTQLHAYTILQAVWKRAQLHLATIHKIELPPFPGKFIDKETPNNKKTCWLDKYEADLLLKTLKNWIKCLKRHKQVVKSDDAEDTYGMAVLSLFSGLRFGDIAKLTWGEITDKEIAYARDPKGGRAYGVHLNVEIIREMLSERRTRLNRTPRFDELVFMNARGGQWKSVPKMYDEAVEELCLNYVPRRRENKMEKIDFHALRHTFATWLAMQGTSQHEIMGLMGHSSLAMTERYMAHDPSRSQQSVNNMFYDFSVLTGRSNGKGSQKDEA